MKNTRVFLLRLTKLLISIVFFVGQFLQRALFQFLDRRWKPTCIVLYYHSVAREEREAFAKQMDTVLRHTSTVNAADPVRLTEEKHYTAITFDDCFQDVIDNALPELMKRGIRCTMFATVNVLGGYADWWPMSSPERTRRIAGAAALQALPKEWVTIGSHTMTHPYLTALDERDAKYEICESRNKLEVLMGYGINTFSFPYGDLSDETVSWCQDAGYQRVFTTQHRRAFEFPGAFAEGRVKADPSDWQIEFLLKILGGYSWLPQAVELKRRLVGKRAATRN
jgi:peptidoglycan/xylan/chitin deacetylase (PgdA/CDA1 family)